MPHVDFVVGDIQLICNTPKKLDSPSSKSKHEVYSRVRKAEEIFDTYGETIRSTIYFYTKDRVLADDIYQDFFLSLVRRPIRPEIQNIRGYIAKALINDILDSVRRTESHRNLLARYANFRSLARCGQLRNTGHNVVIDIDSLNHLTKMLKKQLSGREAESIILRYIYNLTITEAAEKMQVKKRTFSRYLCVGLKKIRQLMSEKHVSINDPY